jgi:hypothetical protein
MIKNLFIWIEGGDDYWLVDEILKPFFSKDYDYIFSPIEYAQETFEYVSDYLRSIDQMNSENLQTDYIFFADINSKVCVTDKKNYLLVGIIT